MKIVEFNMVVREGGEPVHTGEDDVLTEGESTIETTPVAIVNPADRIRSFHARKHGRPGTRIAFLNGAGLVVSESYADVASRLASLVN